MPDVILEFPTPDPAPPPDDLGGDDTLPRGSRRAAPPVAVVASRAGMTSDAVDADDEGSGDGVTPPPRDLLLWLPPPNRPIVAVLSLSLSISLSRSLRRLRIYLNQGKKICFKNRRTMLGRKQKTAVERGGRLFSGGLSFFLVFLFQRGTCSLSFFLTFSISRFARWDWREQKQKTPNTRNFRLSHSR
jgi:hypothetical protein